MRAVTLPDLIELGKDHAVSTEKLTALIAYNSKLYVEECERAFYRDFAKLQDELPIIEKNETITFRDGRTGVYAPNDLIQEIIGPICRKHHFTLSFGVTYPAEKVRIVGELMHAKGHSKTSEYEAKVDFSGGKSDAQGRGSVISYGMRYATVPLLNLILRGADVDGQGVALVDTRPRITHAAGKPFTIIDHPQGSDEWKQARCGVFTASRAYDAFRKTAKGDWRAERKDYRTELVLGRLTGKPKPDGYQSKEMLDGSRRESDARNVYDAIHGVTTYSVGFVLDNEAPIGCSPDAVIGDFEGLVQIKCPKAATHLQTLRAFGPKGAGDAHDETTAIPEEYFAQIRHELYVTGAAWCDYFSYDASFPESLRAVTIRVMAEDANLSEYARDVQAFLAEVEAESQQIAEMMR